MIPEEFWTSWLAFWLVAGPMVLGFLGNAFSLYLSHYHLDAMKEALKNSRYIYLWGPSLGKRGLIWSLLEISKIAGMVVWPRAYIRVGDVNPVDIEKFPPYLKRLLIIDLTMVIVSVTWAVAVAILLEFR